MKGNIRLVGGSFAIGIAVIAGALYLRAGTEQETTGTLAVAEGPSRGYIEPQDSDGDGVSDWEEALGERVIKSAAVPTTFGISTTSEYQEPTTLTDKFARSFFEDYVTSKNNDLIPQSQEEFLQTSIQAVEENTQSKLYTRLDINPVSDSETAIRAYGNTISEIANRYEVPSVNEASILAQALEMNDPEILIRLIPIRESYEHILADSLLIPVPQSLAEVHLDLVNTYEAILTDIRAMEQAFADPLYTLARMKRYEDDALALVYAFANILIEIKASGVIYANDEPGAFLYLFES